MSADSIVSLITGGTTGLALSGIFLMLFLTHRVHSHEEYEQQVARAERAEARADRLEEAVAETRRALEAADARAEAAVHSAELIANALQRPPSRSRER